MKSHTIILMQSQDGLPILFSGTSPPPPRVTLCDLTLLSFQPLWWKEDTAHSHRVSWFVNKQWQGKLSSHFQKQTNKQTNSSSQVNSQNTEAQMSTQLFPPTPPGPRGRGGGYTPCQGLMGRTSHAAGRRNTTVNLTMECMASVSTAPNWPETVRGLQSLVKDKSDWSLETLSEPSMFAKLGNSSFQKQPHPCRLFLPNLLLLQL